MSDKLFVLGAGSMAEAFLRGVIIKKAVDPTNVYVLNRSNSERLQRLRAEYGIQISQNISDARDARVIVLAVKPMDAKSALEPLIPYLHGQVLISFAAGIPIEWLESETRNRAAVVRTMPNLPVAVLNGATALAASKVVSASELAYVRFLLEQVGTVVDLDESLMDAATAFSGSGPGFVCYFLEAMERAAVQLGFDELTARELLLQTVVGTAKTLQDWGLSPHELRRRVTSPNGTTHAGVQIFEQGRMNDIVCEGLKKAANRSTEMGKAYSLEE